MAGRKLATGRFATRAELEANVRQLGLLGDTWAQIAKACGVSTGCVQGILHGTVGR